MRYDEKPQKIPRNCPRLCRALEECRNEERDTFATLAETWRGMAASSESLHALLDRDPATDADDLNRFETYGSGVGL
jgi:hypothetical protein